MPITIGSPRGEAGVDSLYNTEEKIFDDIRANPGEKAFVFIHSVPFEGSVSLVNLLTSTRLVRKGFDVSIILYGPGVLLGTTIVQRHFISNDDALLRWASTNIDNMTTAPIRSLASGSSP